MKNGCIIPKILLKKTKNLKVRFSSFYKWHIMERTMPKGSKRDQKKTKHTRKQETRTSNQYPRTLTGNCQGPRKGVFCSCLQLSLIMKSNINTEKCSQLSYILYSVTGSGKILTYLVFQDENWTIFKPTLFSIKI